jgi:hypothetical protein
MKKDISQRIIEEIDDNDLQKEMIRIHDLNKELLSILLSDKNFFITLDDDKVLIDPSVEKYFENFSAGDQITFDSVVGEVVGVGYSTFMKELTLWVKFKDHFSYFSADDLHLISINKKGE